MDPVHRPFLWPMVPAAFRSQDRPLGFGRNIQGLALVDDMDGEKSERFVAGKRKRAVRSVTNVDLGVPASYAIGSPSGVTAVAPLTIRRPIRAPNATAAPQTEKLFSICRNLDMSELMLWWLRLSILTARQARAGMQ
jgi:hypothetical protein